jgi:hypothetical protein
LAFYYSKCGKIILPRDETCGKNIRRMKLPVLKQATARGRTQNVGENRVLRKILVPEREEITGIWRKLYDELNNLYYSQKRRQNSRKQAHLKVSIQQT